MVVRGGLKRLPRVVSTLASLTPMLRLRGHRSLLWTFICVSVIFVAVHAVAQRGAAGAPPPYTPFVWDEDWSYLSEPTLRQDWSDNIRYVQLGDNAANYVSFGGQIRERGEYTDYPAWGAQPADNGYLQQRYILNADLHVGDLFRMFVQLSSGIEDGRDGGPRPGIDEDKADFNQTFIDVKPWHDGESSFNIRVGRQLVALGSTRLVAIGAGLNVQQPFDGFRLTLKTRAWTLEGLALRPTLIKTGVFDNEPNPAEEFWGIYATHKFPWLPHAIIDVYYLGIDHKSVIFFQGTGREQRESIGARIYARTPTWYYDYEYTQQFGWFGAGTISAWGLGTNSGYRFPQVRWTPRIELDAGVTSGDHNLHDNRLGTFNPLFPNGSYLSQSLLIGPYNVIIARPKLELDLTKSVSFQPNLEFLWRQSTFDGIYNIAGFPTHPGTASSARYVGGQIQAEIDWTANRHLSAALVYEHFFPGEFLKQTPPNKSVNFISPQLTYTF